MKSLNQLKKEYNLELNRIIKEIKKQNAKSVLLQFPDGLKPHALEIADYLEEKTNAEISIWLGSCFGACDIPNSKSDLLIQFGHAQFNIS